MTDSDAIDMMRHCAEELQLLRNNINSLAPKAAAYDTICQILGLLPKQSQGYSEDLVWKLRREIEKLQMKVKGETTHD